HYCPPAVSQMSRPAWHRMADMTFAPPSTTIGARFTINMSSLSMRGFLGRSRRQIWLYGNFRFRSHDLIDKDSGSRERHCDTESLMPGRKKQGLIARPRPD